MMYVIYVCQIIIDRIKSLCIEFELSNDDYHTLTIMIIFQLLDVMPQEIKLSTLDAIREQIVTK